jgi:two-component system, NarL family, nitrate/nitrite response regulator NarL
MGRDGLVDSGKNAATRDGARPIRVVLVDDHPIVRSAVKGLLNLEEDIEVVGEGTDGRETQELLKTTNPDVLVLDLSMPHMDGLATLQELQRAGLRIKVIILTASEDKNQFVQAMKLGCSGIVTKQTAPEQIAGIIRRVHAGEIWLDPHTTAAVMRQFGPAPGPVSVAYPEAKRVRSELSQREREIVALVAQGYKNREMAEKMFISEQTVKNHLHNIFDKLGVSDRLELALHAIHSGWHTVEK